MEKQTPSHVATTSTAKPAAAAPKKAAAPNKAAARKTVKKTADPAPVQSREELIALGAYYRAEQRGFAPGYEVEDWLAAEAALAVLESPPTRRRPA